MNLSIKEQIKLMVARQGMTLGQLAESTGQTRQNLSVAMRRGDYTTNYLQKIADALECDLIVEFVPKAKKSAK